MYGTIVKEGVPQNGVTVTIQNEYGIDTRITDVDGHYIYDDLAALPYVPGCQIIVSVPGASNSFIAASEPEEKEINLFYISISSGSAGLNGTSVSFTLTRTVPVSSGSITLSGTAAGLLTARKLLITSGSIVLAGTGTSLITLRKIIIANGTIVLVGTEGGLIYSGGNIRFFVDIACISGANMKVEAISGANMKVEAISGANMKVEAISGANMKVDAISGANMKVEAVRG